ncbi:hypothetical protein [Clostridium kluyveri]|uniref:Uncharacterized protein n=1 Tax=Clostridium kluyveri TaxID=1534 RepID=A0A1L5F8Y9_CLOKL|nr:hypothetical protein [Clostridium kluyveri]APM39437.1 hypothetical protein BS101_12125 [Clostridium kluyveri]
MEKIYKTWEAMKMLTENPKLKFKVESGDCTQTLLLVSGGIRVDCEGCYGCQTCSLRLDGKWKEVQGPVTFMEAVESDGRVKVEHVLLSKLTKCRESTLKQYNPLCDLMYLLGRELLSSELKEVILNGKWYIKGAD